MECLVVIVNLSIRRVLIAFLVKWLGNRHALCRRCKRFTHTHKTNSLLPYHSECSQILHKIRNECTIVPKLCQY
jgi:hypothetical protein